MNCGKFFNYLTVANFCSCWQLYLSTTCYKVEHFDAAMVIVSGLLIAVMGV